VRKRIVITIICLLIIVAAVGSWTVLAKRAATPVAQRNQAAADNQTKAQDTPQDSFDKTAHSVTDPGSIWAIVNKQHPMNPVSYVPGNLQLPNVSQRLPGAAEMKMAAPAATALEQLFGAANQAGYKLQISTAYRGYAFQKTLYDGYVANLGQAAADKQSARPGYSEHQTGLAVDIRRSDDRCSLEACFGDLPEGKWLAEHAYEYGFLLRYPSDKEAVTGYMYEPWHFRYVGTDLSTHLHEKHITTLEEFFGVSGGTTYK